MGGSKARIAEAASEILARRGFNGMGLKALADQTGLPYGSIYHHFPGGKEEIAAAAIRAVGDLVGDLVTALFAATPPADAVQAMFAYMADRLAQSDWADGCPVGTPAQDGADDSPLVREACAAAFARLVDGIADGLVTQGVARPQAENLATAVVSAYEGAALVARVQRSVHPLHSTGEAMAAVVATAIPSP